jgi:type II secretory pathway component PulK
MNRARRELGLVLVVVVFFIALLMASVSTFLRRATMDASIAHNRDAVARAEALARGGIRLAEALLIEDLRLEEEEGLPRESLQDVWAQARSLQLPLADDERLHLEIEDSGARLNLNSLSVDQEEPQKEKTEPFLVEVLRKVIDEMQVRPEQKNFDPVELARNLIDWIDKDPDRGGGGLEDAHYQRQRPPYRAPNGPLLSLDELRLVEGFNGLLVEALRPYLGVFPLVPAEEGGGINPNTAPPWVLALLYYAGAVGDQRLMPKDDVRRLLKEREEALLCPDETDDPLCLPLRDALDEDPNSFYPPVSYSSNVFRIVSEARVGDVQRRIEAVIDRGLPSQPLRLAWRTQ